MSTRKFHEMWIEQCDATDDIKLRYGVKAAFDYLVGEKLLNFIDAATTHPEFARELPRFVVSVRGLFTPQEIRTHLARVEREQREYDANYDNEEVDEFGDDDELGDDNEVIREAQEIIAQRVRQFATVKELLTAAELGTS